MTQSLSSLTGLQKKVHYKQVKVIIDAPILAELIIKTVV